MDIVEILDRYAEGDEFQRPIETAIEEITKLREQLAAQAAVIESLKEALHYSLGAWEYDGVSDEHGSIFREANDRCDTPTDSTQILDEVRRAERERVAKMVRDCMFKIGQQITE